MDKIRVAIIGIGNCASSLIQGIHYYKDKNREDSIGLMHWTIGGYAPSDIEIVAAFDIDKRKVGVDINKAILSDPNCTVVFHPNIAESGIKVRMGKILDGFSEHIKDYDEKFTFLVF